MSGLDRPEGTYSSVSSLTDGRPGALEQKGLAQVQTVWSQVSLDDQISFLISTPLTLAQHPLLLIPGSSCSSQGQPAALQLHEEGLLL